MIFLTALCSKLLLSVELIMFVIIIHIFKQSRGINFLHMNLHCNSHYAYILRTYRNQKTERKMNQNGKIAPLK